MPQQYGAHDVPYLHDAGYAAAIRDDERVKRVLVWDNQEGCVLSNAGNVGLESGGSASTWWVPKGDYTGKTGTFVGGEAGPNPNNSVDTIRGGPGLWREHMFSVDVRGYDRMFVEWRGEVKAASGFALASPGPSLAKAAFFSNGIGWATGTFTAEDTLSYMREPPVVCYDSAQEGKNGSTLGGLTNASADFFAIEAEQIANGLVLWCAGFGPMNRLRLTDIRAIKEYASAGGLMKDKRNTFGGPLSSGGMIWGFRSTDSGSVDTSRYPFAGQRLMRTMRIGYAPTNTSAAEDSSGLTIPFPQDLCISGLARVWFAMNEVFPATTTGILWPGGPTSRLDFTNASMTIIGKIHVILVRDR
jgi:hypothetical protein